MFPLHPERAKRVEGRARSLHEAWLVELPRARHADAAPLAALAWDVRPGPGVLEARLSAPNVRVIAALDRGGRIVGVATGRILGDGRAASDETVVHASWRGRGLASALIGELAACMRRRGMRVLEGESSGQRLRELEFFRRQGFRVTGMWIAHGVDGYTDGEKIYRTAKTLTQVGRVTLTNERQLSAHPCSRRSDRGARSSHRIAPSSRRGGRRFRRQVR